MLQPLTLQEIHAIELNILIDIDRFCRKHGIRYSLDGGTLLGAIRHKGFIPWDDDIDIIMLREDYNYFVENYRSESGRYRLCNKDTNPAYRTQMFSKVIDIQTVADEGLYEQQEAYGLWVDVFPADYVPVDVRACRRIQKRFLRYRHLLFVRQRKKSEKTLRDKLYSAFYLWKSNNSALCAAERYAKDVENSGYVSNLTMVFERLLGFHFPAALFCDLTDVSFEGYTFKGFAGYDNYLTELYGDYMKLPPMEKRSTHYVTAYLKDAPSTIDSGKED